MKNSLLSPSTGVNAPVAKLPTESVTRIVKAYVFGTRPRPFRHVTPGLPSETAPHQQRKPFVQLRSRSSRAGAINLGVGIFGLIARVISNARQVNFWCESQA